MPVHANKRYRGALRTTSPAFRRPGNQTVERAAWPRRSPGCQRVVAARVVITVDIGAVGARGAGMNASDLAKQGGNVFDAHLAVAVGIALIRANFFGQTYSQLYVNNRGNVTFDAPLFAYTAEPIQSTSHIVIAPFWADVDTTAQASDVVTYGQTQFAEHAAFCANWVSVGYFYAHTDQVDRCSGLDAISRLRVTGFRPASIPCPYLGSAPISIPAAECEQ